MKIEHVSPTATNRKGRTQRVVLEPKFGEAIESLAQALRDHLVFDSYDMKSFTFFFNGSIEFRDGAVVNGSANSVVCEEKKS